MPFGRADLGARAEDEVARAERRAQALRGGGPPAGCRDDLDARVGIGVAEGPGRQERAVGRHGDRGRARVAGARGGDSGKAARNAPPLPGVRWWPTLARRRRCSRGRGGARSSRPRPRPPRAARTARPSPPRRLTVPVPAAVRSRCAWAEGAARGACGGVDQAWRRDERSPQATTARPDGATAALGFVSGLRSFPTALTVPGARRGDGHGLDAVPALPGDDGAAVIADADRRRARDARGDDPRRAEGAAARAHGDRDPARHVEVGGPRVGVPCDHRVAGARDRHGRVTHPVRPRGRRGSPDRRSRTRPGRGS